MNKQRRKRIDKVRIAMTALREEVESIAYEEREAIDNLPENLLESEQAAAMDEASEYLEDAAEELSAVDDLLGSAYDQ